MDNQSKMLLRHSSLGLTFKLVPDASLVANSNMRIYAHTHRPTDVFRSAPTVKQAFYFMREINNFLFVQFGYDFFSFYISCTLQSVLPLHEMF